MRTSRRATFRRLVSRCAIPSCAQSASALSRRVRARTGRRAARTHAAASPLEDSGTFSDKAVAQKPGRRR